MREFPFGPMDFACEELHPVNVALPSMELFMQLGKLEKVDNLVAACRFDCKECFLIFKDEDGKI